MRTGARSARSLRAWQRRFAAAIRVPHAVRAGRRVAVAEARELTDTAANSRFTVAARLAVYGDGYWLRLVEVLAGDYPALRDQLGAATFAGLARAYLEAHPSRHPNLNRLGGRLPHFLARRSGVTAELVALARLELALTRAFDAPEPTPPVGDPFAALGDGLAEARLALHPSVQILRLPASVVDRFDAWRLGGSPPEPRSGRVDVCIARNGEQLARSEVPAPMALVLRRLARGETVARAVDGLPETAALAGWFAKWRADGLIAGVRRPQRSVCQRNV